MVRVDRNMLRPPKESNIHQFELHTWLVTPHAVPAHLTKGTLPRSMWARFLALISSETKDLHDLMDRIRRA